MDYHKDRIYHTLSRILERYGREFTVQDILDIEERYLNGKCPLSFIVKQPYHKPICLMRVYGHWYAFGFDDKRGQIATCLPKHIVQFYRITLDRLKRDFVRSHIHLPDHPLWKHCNVKAVIDCNQLKANENRQAI